MDRDGGPSDAGPSDASPAPEDAGDLVFNIDAILCANITMTIVGPIAFELGIATPISGAASNDAGDDFSVRWNASAGHFGDDAKAHTTFTCSKLGWETVTLLVMNENLCSDALATAILCIEPRN